LGEVAQLRLVPLSSPPLFLEYQDVLKRPEHRLARFIALKNDFNRFDQGSELREKFVYRF
jgi:hypothetical protein